MKMYFSYFKHQIKNQLQYRSSTFILMFVSATTVIGSLLAFMLVFSQFKQIGNYTINDVLITFSTITMIFALSEALFRGLDQFSRLVSHGNLDTLLLRPRGLVLQIIGHKFEFQKLGRVIASIGILIWAAIASGIEWNALKIITLILMVISGVVIFFGVFMLGASYTIFSVTGNEVVNIFTDGGRESASYPLDIYKKGFKNFFTFILPFATFNYLPLHFILDKPGANVWLNMMAPIYGMLFVIPCYFIFKWALTKYKSSGT